MDLISQIQNYILSLSKLLNRAFERILEVPPLNPDDALICSTMDDKSQEGRQTDVDHDGGVSQPYYQTSTDTKHGKNEKEKVTEWERNKLESPLYASTGIGLIEEGKEIFNRVGTVDTLMASLPIAFPSEQEQQQQIVAAQRESEKADVRLRKAMKRMKLYKSKLATVIDSIVHMYVIDAATITLNQ